jgi:hypothetical protein
LGSISQSAGQDQVPSRRRFTVYASLVAAVAAALLCWAPGAGAATWTPQEVTQPKTESTLNGVACVSTTACFGVGSSGALSLNEMWTTSWKVLESPAETANLTHISCAPKAKLPCLSIAENGRGEAAKPEGAGVVWKSNPLVEVAGMKVLSISCGSTTFCMATGSDAFGTYSLAEVWNGTKWSVITSPNGKGVNSIDAVSCTSGTSCTAIGYLGSAAEPTALRWNGETWTSLAAPPADASDISCLEANWCMAVYPGGGGTYLGAELWNGVGWTASKVPGLSSTIAPPSVSCTSTTFCETVTTETTSGGSSRPVAGGWNGLTWTAQHPPYSISVNTKATGVSCQLATCEAVGHTGAGAASRPIAWRYE